MFVLEIHSFHIHVGKADLHRYLRQQTSTWITYGVCGAYDCLMYDVLLL